MDVDDDDDDDRGKYLTFVNCFVVMSKRDDDDVE